MAYAFGDTNHAKWQKQQILPPYSNTLELSHPLKSQARFRAWAGYVLLAFLLAGTVTSGPFFELQWRYPPQIRAEIAPFYYHVKTPTGLCHGENGAGVSHSGYIGLSGDSEEQSKRSFFWYFEVQEHAEDAPVVLTVGGGPGTSGMMNALSGQSHCVITPNGTAPNLNPWTAHFNLIALDHPIGAGFSYGTRVNDSRTAALDVYDFLQKFFHLYPHLAKSQFVVTGGSYGGIYVPNIATVIHEQNHAVASGKGQPGAVHINLESLMISNPMSDPISHFRWVLHHRCYNTDVYNATTCREMYAILPYCLEAIEFALENSSVANRVAALELCGPLLHGDTHDTVLEDVRIKCNSKGDPDACRPRFGWATDFFHRPETKHALGVPPHVNFSAINRQVNHEFSGTGDPIQQAHLMYEPLLRDGVRLLHIVGLQDANCAWPGILSFLKLLRTPFQEQFIHAPDVPWPSKEEATVRVIGEGAGNMTLVLVAEAGHFVTHDQPALTRQIVEHWIENQPYV